MIIQTLASCCIDNIGALCDIYKFNVKDLVDLPAYHLLFEGQHSKAAFVL